MTKYIRSLLFAAITLAVACGNSKKTPDEPPRAPADGAQSAAGTACVGANDCPASMQCHGGSCEPLPCTSKLTGGEDDFAVYNETADRQVTTQSFAAGKPTIRLETRYEDAGKRHVSNQYEPGNTSPVMSTRSVLDERGRRVRGELVVDGRPAMKMTFDYHDDSCPLGYRATYMNDAGDVVTEVHQTCGANGRLDTNTATPKQGVARIITYEYENSRLAAIRTHRDNKLFKSIVFVRESNGFIAEQLTDNDGDGNVDSRERYDYSCWRNEDGVYRRTNPPML